MDQGGDQEVMKFFIQTFGCQMNVCDSTWIEMSLVKRGYRQVDLEEDADIILVNTCSVRKKPEEKLYSFLGRIAPLYKKRPSIIVGVGGCVAQQLGEKIWEKFPFVRLVFGTDGVASVPQSIERLIKEDGLKICLLNFMDYYPERNLPPYKDITKNMASAYINIMQGCDNFCAYCIVPYTRGRQKSRHSSNIIKECEMLVDAGVKEITLLGQNVNSYGMDKYGDGVSFVELLRKVSNIKGLKRLRFTTSHPKDISDELISLFGILENLCPSIHLPLQSGSNNILKKMGRKYNKEDYLKIIDKLRKINKDIVITTDLIVGFPGETEQDFKDTLEMMKLVGFDSSFSFKYSDRPNTRASKMMPKIQEKIKGERLSILQGLQEELTNHSMERLKDKIVEVMVEGISTKQFNKNRLSYKGREPGNRIVNFLVPQNMKLNIGDIVTVKINKIKKHSLFGEVIY